MFTKQSEATELTIRALQLHVSAIESGAFCRLTTQVQSCCLIQLGFGLLLYSIFQSCFTTTGYLAHYFLVRVVILERTLTSTYFCLLYPPSFSLLSSLSLLLMTHSWVCLLDSLTIFNKRNNSKFSKINTHFVPPPF